MTIYITESDLTDLVKAKFAIYSETVQRGPRGLPAKAVTERHIVGFAADLLRGVKAGIVIESDDATYDTNPPEPFASL